MLSQSAPPLGLWDTDHASNTMGPNSKNTRSKPFLKSIVIIPVFREIGKIGSVLSKFEPSVVDQICLVIDDPIPSILQEIDEARKTIDIPVTIIENPVRKGIGHAIRQGYSYALANGYELVVVMAGNGKDDPREIPRLTSPILKHGFDYVQGSRYVRGGRHDKNPFIRSAFVRMFPHFSDAGLVADCGTIVPLENGS